MAAPVSAFDPWLARWNLSADGAALSTRSSELLPVRRAGLPAMLKVAAVEEERWGGLVMDYWEGRGAARVLAREGAALLLERITGPLSLSRMVYHGHDDEATRVLCAVAARLHAPRPRPRPAQLISLAEWFAPLEPIARAHGGVLALAAAAAQALFADPRDLVVLHGDLHHDNVLDGEARGWLAIDPQPLYGERGFDFANLLRNPDPEPAIVPGRLARQVDVAVAAARLERTRLLQWVLALAGLSAASAIAEHAAPDFDLVLAELAAAELARAA